MKLHRYSFMHLDRHVATELNMSTLKFRMILERYGITKRGWVMYEFKLRGLIDNEKITNSETGTTKEVLVFSDKGKRWVKKLIPLLDSDITTSDWVE